ncbi:unnamed protein product [Musa hybrid cultivar]
MEDGRWKMEDGDSVHRRKRGINHEVLLPLLTRRTKSGGTEQKEGVGDAKCFCLVGRLTSRLLRSRPLSSGAVSASAAHVSEEGGVVVGGASSCSPCRSHAN